MGAHQGIQLRDRLCTTVQVQEGVVAGIVPRGVV
jgi:hypothetical protein